MASDRSKTTRVYAKEGPVAPRMDSGCPENVAKRIPLMAVDVIISNTPSWPFVPSRKESDFCTFSPVKASVQSSTKNARRFKPARRTPLLFIYTFGLATYLSGMHAQNTLDAATNSELVGKLFCDNLSCFSFGLGSNLGQ